MLISTILSKVIRPVFVAAVLAAVVGHRRRILGASAAAAG
jgi:hypothetical protein